MWVAFVFDSNLDIWDWEGAEIWIEDLMQQAINDSDSVKGKYQEFNNQPTR